MTGVAESFLVLDYSLGFPARFGNSSADIDFPLLAALFMPILLYSTCLLLTATPGHL